ncbi:hypothetical protein [Sphingomonas sp. UNC305MFCol5.2]|uniref:hypothetical protein n=1 Tax=Sphingomonas sp. UNC305MFCol5.2 TaxID=1449076 RepID=UPI0004A3ED19|nr:hypothetical protein [Sphingomonas sp. UNC305MFCol5.2]
MATGFDSRQVTRQSFAFEGAKPSQARPAANGASARAQIVGGQSGGGVVVAGPQTDPGPVAGQLGQFFEGLMQPYIERKQSEKFFEGFTMAQEGIALEELNNSDSTVKTIFGPTAFEQGAQFFTAKTTLDQWTQDRYADMDRLKTLDPKEAAKELAATSRSLMTKDPFANQMIQAGLIEATGPLMNAVAKARYAYGQEQAINAWTASGKSGAGALQAAASAQAVTAGPTEGPSSALIQQSQAFLGGMVKPEGMDDETYRKGLYNFMRGAMQDGNFYAVSLMRKAGIDKIFGEDEQVKLDDAQHRYGQRAMEDASISLLVEDMADYEEARATSSMSSLDATNRLMAMNAKVKRFTGLEEDLFDFTDMKGETRSLMELAVANWWRKKQRDWQKEDRAYARQTAIEVAERDNREAAAASGMAWASGDVEAAIAQGIEAKHFNRLALRDFRNGDYRGLARAFTVGHYTSTAVKNDIQGAVKGSLEEQYGKNFGRAFQTWQGMMQVNPGMTSEYYGEYHEKMRAFGTLAKTVGPEAAYRQAFGDPARYSSATVPPALRKEADEAVAAAVMSKQSAWYNPFGTRYSPQAIRVMQNLVRERVALGLQNSDTPSSTLAPEAMNAALSDGSLQVAGGEAWRAAPGTKPFRVQLGLQQDEADAVFRAQVDFRLRRAGSKSGINSTLDINYIDMPNGQKALHVIGRDREGNSRNILIPMQAFREEHAQRLRNNRPLSATEREKMRRETYFRR